MRPGSPSKALLKNRSRFIPLGRFPMPLRIPCVLPKGSPFTGTLFLGFPNNSCKSFLLPRLHTARMTSRFSRRGRNNDGSLLESLLPLSLALAELLESSSSLSCCIRSSVSTSMSIFILSPPKLQHVLLVLVFFFRSLFLLFLFSSSSNTLAWTRGVESSARIASSANRGCDCQWCDNSRYRGTDLLARARCRKSALIKYCGTSRRLRPFRRAASASSRSVRLARGGRSFHMGPDGDVDGGSDVDVDLLRV
mmetsp:Transcript_26507/g.55652  ORF Transcript_26507/g.55652 Transcript_26507/m.55652 type:complete len:251 (+) Transcript_26507:1783-2535(+)